MVRHKNRYILFEISSRSGDKALKLHQHMIYEAVVDKIQQLFGDFGVAATKPGLSAVYCNAVTRIVLIRARHGPHKLVSSAISALESIALQPITVRTVNTQATITQCFKFLARYQQKKFDEFCVSLKTDNEKSILKDAMMNLSSMKKALT